MRPRGRRVEGEIHLSSDRSSTDLRVGQTGRVGHRQRDPVAGVAAEVVTGRRDRERAALHAGDRGARVDVAFVQEVDVPGEGAGGKRPVVGVGAVPAERDDVTGTKKLPSCGDRMVAVGGLPTLIVSGVESVVFDAVGDREPRRVLARLRVRVARVGGRRGRAVAERPGVGERLALGIRRARAREVDGKRRRPGGRVGRRDRDRRLVAAQVADPADLADAEGAADVGVAEVDVVQRAVGPLREVHDVAVRAVERAVERLEVEDAGDVPAGVERQPLDPVLRVVGEEVAALVASSGTASRGRRTRR